MDQEVANSLVFLLATATLLADILLIALVIVYFLSKTKKSKLAQKITTIISENVLSLGLIVTSFAVVGSLFLSEVVQFVPCELCWYQRILMYPQVVLFGIALWKNDFGVKKYAIALSVIGLFIAFYHMLLQAFPAALPCSDEVANCALAQFNYFGFITIPEMSATAFGLLIILMVMGKKKS